MEFKHVGTYISRDAAKMYKVITEARGYKVRIVENKDSYGHPFQWQVYQSREKVK